MFSTSELPEEIWKMFLNTYTLRLEYIHIYIHICVHVCVYISSHIAIVGKMANEDV